MTAVKIPYDQLTPEALQGVIEEFVTRDGTDYGEVEVTLETKISQVLGQLKSGKIRVLVEINFLEVFGSGDMPVLMLRGIGAGFFIYY